MTLSTRRLVAAIATLVVAVALITFLVVRSGGDGDGAAPSDDSSEVADGSSSSAAGDPSAAPGSTVPGSTAPDSGGPGSGESASGGSGAAGSDAQGAGSPGASGSDAAGDGSTGGAAGGGPAGGGSGSGQGSGAGPSGGTVADGANSPFVVAAAAVAGRSRDQVVQLHALALRTTQSGSTGIPKAQLPGLAKSVVTALDQQIKDATMATPPKGSPAAHLVASLTTYQSLADRLASWDATQAKALPASFFDELGRTDKTWQSALTDLGELSGSDLRKDLPDLVMPS